MVKGQGIVYMTEGAIRVGYRVDGPQEGPVAEDRMALSHTPDDCRRFAQFLAERKFVPERLVLCIPRARASVRFLRFPSQDEVEIRRMAAYELNSLFPLKPDEFVSGHAVTERLADGSVRLMFVAVQRQVIAWYLDFVKWAGIHPDEIWVSTQALCNSFLRSPRAGNTCLAYADGSSVELMFFRGETLVFDRCVSVSGGVEGERAIMREMLAGRGYACDRVVAAGPDLAGAGEFISALGRELGCGVETEPGFSISGGLPAEGERGMRLNLLPEELKAVKASSARRKQAALLAAAVLLNCILGLNLFFVRQSAKREYLAVLSGRIKTMDAQTVALRKKLSRLRSFEHSAGSGVHKLNLLSGLASVCPAQVLLRSLDISGEERNGTLIAAGKARDADTVLQFAAALKKTPSVSKADVSYISKRPDAGGWVDFEIKAAY